MADIVSVEEYNMNLERIEISYSILSHPIAYYPALIIKKN